jgi:hypothetical protein
VASAASQAQKDKNAAMAINVKNIFRMSSFYRNGLGEVARLVYVAAAAYGYVICEQL